MASTIVLDASAIVDVLTQAPDASWLRERLRDADLVTPGHALAEVLDAVGRAARRGVLPAAEVDAVLRELRRMPMRTVDVSDLLAGAWARRDQHSLADALYVELAAQLSTVVVTTDRKLARATPLAVAPPG